MMNLVERNSFKKDPSSDFVWSRTHIDNKLDFLTDWVIFRSLCIFFSPPFWKIEEPIIWNSMAVVDVIVAAPSSASISLSLSIVIDSILWYRKNFWRGESSSIGPGYYYYTEKRENVHLRQSDNITFFFLSRRFCAPHFCGWNRARHSQPGGYKNRIYTFSERIHPSSRTQRRLLLLLPLSIKPTPRLLDCPRDLFRTCGNQIGSSGPSIYTHLYTLCIYRERAGRVNQPLTWGRKKKLIGGNFLGWFCFGWHSMVPPSFSADCAPLDSFPLYRWLVIGVYTPCWASSKGVYEVRLLTMCSGSTRRNVPRVSRAVHVSGSGVTPRTGWGTRLLGYFRGV